MLTSNKDSKLLYCPSPTRRPFSVVLAFILNVHVKHQSPYANMTNPTPYEILEITPIATPAEIKAAYRRLILIHHPDKAPPDKHDSATKKFRDIQQAYEVLTDPEKATEYLAEQRREQKFEERAERAERARKEFEKEVRRHQERAMKREKEKDVEADEGGEGEGEDSRRKRKETERNTRKNKEMEEMEKGRREQKAGDKHGRKNEGDKERNGRSMQEKDDMKDRQPTVDDECDARDGKAGKKKVQFTQGSSPPPPRPRATSPSPDVDGRSHRKPSHRDLAARPPTPSFAGRPLKHKSKRSNVHVYHHVERDRNGIIFERHAEVHRSPSHYHHKYPDSPLLPFLPPFPPPLPVTHVHRAKSHHHLTGPDVAALPSLAPPPDHNSTPPSSTTLTTAAHTSATHLTTHLTALSTHLTTDLLYSPTHARCALVTFTLTALSNLSTHLTTIQSHADATLARQARSEATRHRPDTRELARLVSEAGRLERMLGYHAEKVRGTLFEVLGPAGVLRVSQGDKVDEDVVAAVQRGWEKERNREEGPWSTEKRGRLWGVLKACREEAGRLVPEKRS